MDKTRNRTKILIESPLLTASVRVGVMRVLSDLVRTGQCELRYRDTKEIRKEDILWCDCVICVRGCEYATLRFAQTVKKFGRFLVYFLDDDLLDVPSGHESTNYFCDPQIKTNLISILSISDVLWAVNPGIIEKYQKWCKRTVLTHVPAQIVREVPVYPAITHILYAGSVDHSGVVRERLTYAVSELSKKYHGKVDFTFIGADPGLYQLDNVRHLPYFDSYDQYREYLLKNDFSIGLAPTYHSPFYSCKYYNKFVEYSEYGIAGVYENCAPYTSVVINGVNGLLCGERPEDWYQALEELIKNPERTRQIASECVKMLKKEFRVESIAAQLSEKIPELIYYQADNCKKQNVRIPDLWLLFYLGRVRLMWRMYGLSAIFIVPLKAYRVVKKMLLKKRRKYPS